MVAAFFYKELCLLQPPLPWNFQLKCRYLTYFMQFMALLKETDITPVVVFAGLNLPFKKSAHEERLRARQAALDQGLELHKQGKLAEAEERFRESVAVSDDMVNGVISKLTEQKIQCIVAPSEAAAQLAYLAKTGKVDAVYTGNLDPLVFGCPKILYNVMPYGFGVEIFMDKIINNRESIFHKCNAETIRHICMLSGGDYLPAVKGVSPTTLLNLYKRSNNNTDQVIINLKQQLKNDLPVDYGKRFQLANLGSLYQWVYDMDKKSYVRLNPLPSHYSKDYVAQMLGDIPTEQQCNMLSINDIASKRNSKQEPITKKSHAYADSDKENDMPSHHGSPSSKPPKSPLAPTASLRTKARRHESQLRLPGSSSNVPSPESASVKTTALKKDEMASNSTTVKSTNIATTASTKTYGAKVSVENVRKASHAKSQTSRSQTSDMGSQRLPSLLPKKRCFEETEHSASTVQGNVAKRHMPSHLRTTIVPQQTCHQTKPTPSSCDQLAKKKPLSSSNSDDKEKTTTTTTTITTTTTTTTTRKRSFNQVEDSPNASQCNQPRKKALPSASLLKRHQ
ncbi:hypothetical protein MBANPS3_009856 [Mucor bainieri]